MSSTIQPPQVDLAEAADASAAAGLNKELLGWLALIVTITIWSVFSLTIRAISRSELAPADVALMRFAIPSLVLLPLLPSRLKRLRSVPVTKAAMISAGAGLPFFLIAAQGGKLTSAAHVSALIAGTLPLSLVIVSSLFLGKATWRGQVTSLVVILAGVIFMVAGFGRTGIAMGQGVALLLVASLLWGMYTFGLRRANLDPVSSVMLVSYPSFVLILPLVATGLLESHLSHVSFSQVLPFLLVQGCGVGVISTFSYVISIRLLGEHRCITIGALQPVITTLLAIPLLSESPTVPTMIGVLAVTVGVLLSHRGSVNGYY
jgi:drug/metabolite transporter (DMT)-like permease